MAKGDIEKKGLPKAVGADIAEEVGNAVAACLMGQFLELLPE